MSSEYQVERLQALALSLPAGHPARAATLARLGVIEEPPRAVDPAREAAPAGDYADRYPDDIPWDDLDLVLDALEAHRVEVEPRVSWQPSAGAVCEGQSCWFCGEPCAPGKWFLIPADGPHRFACSPLFAVACGRRMAGKEVGA